MRIRTSVAALGSALALAAVAVPSAQAQGAPDGPQKVHSGVANGGKSLIVQANAPASFTVTFTVTDPKRVKRLGTHAYFGASSATASGWANGKTTCTGPDTTKKCTAVFTVDPKVQLGNHNAGQWKIIANIQGSSPVAVERHVTTMNIKRATKITVNASPEPVTKNKTLTISGKLTRANFDSLGHGAHANQYVELEFRPAGSDKYRLHTPNLKTDKNGVVQIHFKASQDGYWRFRYFGNATSGAATAQGDYVDVR
ncbi:calcium-binding protein [Streptomyces sp. NPDC047315]|uniref:calcium-binding protein n=1 Tax=Streptomyces sp. NPDC047315 TaxID=3155142 RepID=UPI0033F37E14